MAIEFDLSDLKGHAPIHKIGIKTAWVVWEPIELMQNDFARKTVRHCFLVFKLTEGITDDGHKFFRVERQHDVGDSDQKADPNKAGVSARAQPMLQRSTKGNRPVQPSQVEKEAVLRIRVATNRTAALYMDTTAYPDGLNDLHKEGADQPSKPLYGVTCRHVVAFNPEEFKLGALLKILMEVHTSKPNYNLADANCIWYGKAVLVKCRDHGFVAPESREAINLLGHINMAADVGVAALDAAATAANVAYKKIIAFGIDFGFT